MRVEVTHYDVKTAFWVWFHVRDESYGNAVRSFYKFTGIVSFLEDPQLVDEEQARRIRLMAGPHGATLLKAHAANETSMEV